MLIIYYYTTKILNLVQKEMGIMSYKSKKMIASMVAAAALLIAYIVYALGSKAPAPDDLKAWGVAMLVFIGVSVVAMIVIQILFHITFAIGLAVKEGIAVKGGERDDKALRRIFDSETVEDERDKLVELKSARIGYIIGGAGFIAALFALVTGHSALFALHIIFGAFFIGSAAEGVAGVYQYERGVRNG